MCQKLVGSSVVDKLMLIFQAAQNLLMPYPGTDKESKCPAVAQGEGGWGVLGTAGID